MANNQSDWRNGKLTPAESRTAWILICIFTTVAGIVIGANIFGPENNAPFSTDDLEDFFSGIYMEIISIIVTVFLVILIQNYFAEERRKRELVRKAGSRMRYVALDAMDNLMHEGLVFGENSLLIGVDMQFVDWSETALLKSPKNDSGAYIGINASQSYFFRANLESSVIGYSNLHGATLSWANLRHSVLVEADLDNANLKAAKLQNADLSYANLRGADFTSAYLMGANLNGANLNDANLRHAHLLGVVMTHARLNENTLLPDNTKYNPEVSIAQLRKFGCVVDIKLRDVDFRGVDMSAQQGGYYHSWNLSQADLQGANLNKANMSGVYLVSKITNYTCVTQMDETTILPDGTNYDPSKGIEQMARFGCIVTLDED